MSRNRYEGLNAEQSYKFGRAELALLEEKWAELRLMETSLVANATDEKDQYKAEMMKGQLFAKGFETLKNLSREHLNRKKPNFFLRLFRLTKAARDYVKEEQTIEKLGKTLDTMQKETPDAEFLNELTVNGEPIDVRAMMNDKQYNNNCQYRVDTYVTRICEDRSHRLHETDPDKRTENDKTLIEFLRDYDEKTKNAAIEHVPGSAEIEGAVSEEEHWVDEYESEEAEHPLYTVTYHQKNADFIQFDESSMTVTPYEPKKNVVFEKSEEASPEDLLAPQQEMSKNRAVEGEEPNPFDEPDNDLFK